MILLAVAAALLFGCVERGEVLSVPGEGGSGGSGGGSGGSGGNGSVVSAINAGTDHTCAISDGHLYCWGENAEGAVGAAEATVVDRPVGVGDGSDWTEVTAGESFSCGRRASGAVHCWGSNAHGQLGLGSTTSQTSPIEVSTPEPVTSLAGDHAHACGLGQSGALYCWGDNLEGQGGQNDEHPGTDLLLPTRVTDANDWTNVATGQGHTCAVKSNADLRCWGRNSSNELGLGSNIPEQYRAPELVGAGFRGVIGGQNHTCTLKQDGSAWCFGTDLFGNLGLNTPGAVQSVPARVDHPIGWREVRTDTFATCGIDDEGALYCWGRNAEGQLGTGDTSDRAIPAAVTLPGPWLHVAVGRFHMCAVDRGGVVYCTGENRQGQLGLGDTERRSELTKVEF